MNKDVRIPHDKLAHNEHWGWSALAAKRRSTSWGGLENTVPGQQHKEVVCFPTISETLIGTKGL